MKTGFKWVTGQPDRHGKMRYRFRRTGYPVHNFQSPFGTKDFEREYASCLDREPPPVGVAKIIPGSVSDVIARYYADNAFQDLRPATQKVYRGVLERFRAVFGDAAMRNLDAERIARLMNNMRGKPWAAIRLRKLLTQLFIIARRAKLVPAGFDPVKDTRPPKAETGGYHRWTEEELSAFEATHPLGSKPRLAYALLLWGAQRSGDVRLMTHEIIAGGRIQLDQNKTSNAVDVPVMPELADALAAGPLGKVTLIEAKPGQPFGPETFYAMMKRACVKAGIPHCSPHGLRKAAARRCREAGCTLEEGMAITGHKTVKEYLRYAGDASRGEQADAATTKILANHAERLAKRDPQPLEDTAKCG